MAPTETGIIDVLLNVARKRSQTAATHDAPKSGAADVPAKQVQRREAQTSDFSPVAALKIRYGLSPDSRKTGIGFGRQIRRYPRQKVSFLSVGFKKRTEKLWDTWAVFRCFTNTAIKRCSPSWRHVMSPIRLIALTAWAWSDLFFDSSTATYS